MMKRQSKCLWAAAACLFATLAWGIDLNQTEVLGDISTNGVFDPSAGDLSLKYLRMIFGTVGNALTGSTNQLMGELFGIFNVGMLVFTGAFVSYTVVTSIVSSAQDGSPMGNKMSAWIPFRIVLGTSMMIPMSGYSGAQILVMWAVVQGVGLADHVWERAVKYLAQVGGNAFQMKQNSVDGTDQFQDLQAIIGSPTASGDRFSITQLYKSAFCLAVAQEMSNNQNGNNTYKVRSGKACSGVNQGKSNAICLGSASDRGACGVYQWPTDWSSLSSTHTAIMNDVGKGYMQITAERTVESLVSSAQQWLQQSLQAYKEGTSSTSTDITRHAWKERVTCAAASASDVPYCQPGNGLVAAATTYLTTLKPARTTIYMLGASQEELGSDAVHKHLEQWRASTLTQGWISAASAYRNLNTRDFGSHTKVASVEHFLLTTHTSPRRLYPINAALKAVYTTVYAPNAAGNTSSHSKIKGYLVNAKKVIQRLQASFYNSQHDVVAYQHHALDSLTKQYLDTLLSFNISNGPFNDKGFFGAGPSLTTAQDNLMTLIRNMISKLVGLGLYGRPPHEYSIEHLYNIHEFGVPAVWSQCQSIHQGSTPCTSTSGEGCFAAATRSQCIVPGNGLLGMIDSTNQGKPVDPIGAMWRLGTEMIDNAVGYWVYTIKSIFHTMKELLLIYSGVTIAANVLGGVGQGVALGAGVGWAAGLAAGLTNAATIFFKLGYQFDSQSVTLYLPFGAMVALVFFMIGVMFAIYIPFVPFLMFTFSAIGWLVAVIEAMVAAPLVALGITHPEGHDLLGKAEQSAILLLGVFIRPVAILIGFLAAIYLVNVAMMLMNTGFLHMIANYMSQTSGVSSSPFIKIIGASGALLVYVYAAMAVVNQAFSLIFQVPDRVLRWIGGPQEQSMVGQMMQEMKGGIRDSAGQAGQAAASRVGQGAGNYSPEGSQAGSGLKEPSQKLGEDLKNNKKASRATAGGESGGSGGVGGGEADGGAGGGSAGGE